MTPHTASDLSKIIRVIAALKTKFAIRSGGHNDVPGFNSVASDGVLIALQNLNKLAISADKMSVTLGTGNRWSAVYRYVAEHGVAVVGGREPSVGVGGFLLGGMCRVLIFAQLAVGLIRMSGRGSELVLQYLWPWNGSNHTISGKSLALEVRVANRY